MMQPQAPLGTDSFSVSSLCWLEMVWCINISAICTPSALATLGVSDLARISDLRAESMAVEIVTVEVANLQYLGHSFPLDLSYQSSNTDDVLSWRFGDVQVVTLR